MSVDRRSMLEQGKMKIGTWAICENSPVRLGSASVEFERYLEDWIETEPNLLQSGIRIVARQLAVGAGIIDLLAIDYASCISTMPSDELIEKTNSYLNPQENSIQSLVGRAFGRRCYRTGKQGY